MHCNPILLSRRTNNFLSDLLRRYHKKQLRCVCFMQKFVCSFVLIFFCAASSLSAQRWKKQNGSTTQVQVSSVSCASTSITGAATDSCSVKLAAAAPSTGQAVTLTSNNSAVAVPASILVSAGAASAGFSATIKAVSTSQTTTITASSAGATKSVALQVSPVATTPKLGVSAASVAFGTVTLNTTSTQSVTLSSTGTAAVTVSAVSVSGTGYSISGIATPMTLNPGQSATLNVMFAPTVAGSVGGTATITSNSSTGSTTAISLSGTGQSVSHEVDLSWAAPTSSPVAVAGYIVLRANSGSSSYQQVNSSSVTQTAFVDSNVTSGQAYNYMVESVDNSGNPSVPSNTASAVIP